MAEKEANILDCEQDFLVELMTYNGMPVWPLMRYHFLVKISAEKEDITVSPGIFRSILRNFHYGIMNLFGRYDYLAFSDSAERREISGVWTDKSIDPIANLLGKTLVFELPNPNHFPKKKIATRSIVSKHLLLIAEAILSLVFLRVRGIKNEAVLAQMKDRFGIKFNQRRVLRKQLAQYHVTRFLATIYRPKAVFLQPSYVNTGRIKAFRDKGIKVVELQHGIISDAHIAYTVHKNIDQHFYPDLLLTFGKPDLSIFNERNYFLDRNKVIPVGHYYLDHMNRNTELDPRLNELKKSYKTVVAVSSQNHYIEEKLISFLKEAAVLDRRVLYIFIPRVFNDKIHHFSDNIIIVDWLNTYEIIAQADFHSTVFSTCAVEAPSLGVQNILIDIDGLASKHFCEILANRKVTRIAQTPAEYIALISSFQKLGKSEIIEENSANIIPGYAENIKKALARIELQ